MTRVFLDANVLFSAAWHQQSGLGSLWEKPDVQLVTSPYALVEAERNIAAKRPGALARLHELAAKIELSNQSIQLSDAHGLPDKDVPIMQTAVGSDCQILLTGDVTHFGHLIGTDVDGIKVMTPGMFLTMG